MTNHRLTNRIPYRKRATDFDRQIALLRSRGVIISDENKAKEHLADIGYYRLGFYIFPFEITYPRLDSRRRHNVKPGTRIEDIVALYYFDFDLRNILNKYLSRIEVSIRTTIIYKISNKYSTKPCWFADRSIREDKFVADFNNEVYCHIRPKKPIQHHHHKYCGRYAPAWKTIEYMTLGNLEVLYDNLRADQDKLMISRHFGEPAFATFKSYMMAIREVRNACAHGNVLFDLTLSQGIRTGAACASFSPGTNQNLNGALKVIAFLLSKVSVNRETDMWQEIYKATATLYAKSPSLRQLIETQTGIIVPANAPLQKECL